MDLVPVGPGQKLLEMSYLGWLMDHTAIWRRGFCWRRVMRDDFGHVCASTLRDFGDSNRQRSRQKGMRLGGPAHANLNYRMQIWNRSENLKRKTDEGGVAGEDGNSCDWVAGSATCDTGRKGHSALYT